jgi:FMN phosphatase YigB (HAD superfamily)
MSTRAVLFDLDDTLVQVPERKGWDDVTRARVQQLRRVPGADAADLDLVAFLGVSPDETVNVGDSYSISNRPDDWAWRAF